MPKGIGYGPGPNASPQDAQNRSDQVGSGIPTGGVNLIKPGLLPSNPQFGNPGKRPNNTPADAALTAKKPAMGR